jgi:hypothetical protein
VEHRIRFNIAFPIVGLCAAGFILVVSAMIGGSINTITGLILAVVSVLQLTVPVVVVTADEFQMRNLFGMTLRRVQYSPETVDVSQTVPRVEGKKVRGFSAWALDGAAVARLRDDIRHRQMERAAGGAVGAGRLTA